MNTRKITKILVIASRKSMILLKRGRDALIATCFASMLDSYQEEMLG